MDRRGIFGVGTIDLQVLPPNLELALKGVRHITMGRNELLDLRVESFLDAVTLNVLRSVISDWLILIEMC